MYLGVKGGSAFHHWRAVQRSFVVTQVGKGTAQHGILGTGYWVLGTYLP